MKVVFVTFVRCIECGMTFATFENDSWIYGNPCEIRSCYIRIKRISSLCDTFERVALQYIAEIFIKLKYDTVHVQLRKSKSSFRWLEISLKIWNMFVIVYLMRCQIQISI